MFVPHGSIVAREGEVEAISSFLDLGHVHGRALLLQGEAGIGKTALWRAGMETASIRGYRVLACAAAVAETQLAFTTVRDLLADAFDDAEADLPSPQRQALAVVLMREDPPDRPTEPGTIAVAFLAALRLLASRTPVLVAIDDVQWVDPASADVLRYALRRLQPYAVKALLARRATNGTEPIVQGAEVLGIGPFSLGALGRLLRGHLAIEYPRRTLQRVHEMSGGNPFYALEIARAIGRPTGQPRPDEPLPVPGTLLQLVRDRVASLPAPTFEALAIASALSRPTVPAIAAVLGADVLPILEPAVRADIVRTDGTAVWFAHPLFAASVYELAARRRRQIHTRLAAVVDDVEERARHLIRAEGEPDGTVAAAIDAGAAAAAARGAPGSAAELARAAARFTPQNASSDQVRRRLNAAEFYIVAGDLQAGRVLLEPLVAELSPGPERARALERLSRTLEPAVAVPVLEQALEEAGGDVKLQVEVQLGLATNLWSTHGIRADLMAATRASELAVEAGEPDLIIAAKGERLLAETEVGIPADPDVVASLTEEYRPHRGNYPPALVAALSLLYRDCLADAREVLDKVAHHAATRGDELTLATASLHLAELECRAGRYAIAAEHAEAALASPLGELEQPLSAMLSLAALADAYRGRVESARAMAERGLELSRRVGDMIWDIQNEAVLGFLDLSVGDPRAAAARLAPLWPRVVERGYGEPSVFPVLPNAIHALLEAGDRPRCERLLEQLEERGRALDSAWALSQAARLRALLAADDGHTDQALKLIDQALAFHDRMQGPFERGRTVMARGVILRRARRKREARESLGQALAVFENLGTPLWAAKARAELARIGGRAPAGDELTPTERRIADLVAEGKTNKEVAAILVVAERTVESALTQIYRKLDVRSRTELARRLVSSA
jgi:DNA-binding CsgD family transcriptional regulator